VNARNEPSKRHITLNHKPKQIIEPRPNGKLHGNAQRRAADSAYALAALLATVFTAMP